MGWNPSLPAIGSNFSRTAASPPSVLGLRRRDDASGPDGLVDECDHFGGVFGPRRVLDDLAIADDRADEGSDRLAPTRRDAFLPAGVVAVAAYASVSAATPFR